MILCDTNIYLDLFKGFGNERAHPQKQMLQMKQNLKSEH